MFLSFKGLCENKPSRKKVYIYLSISRFLEKKMRKCDISSRKTLKTALTRAWAEISPGVTKKFGDINAPPFTSSDLKNFQIIVVVV